MRQIKVEDTYLTMKHYKEPLRPIEKGKGHGFYGCILVSIDGKFIQCHVCGKLFASVSAHARQAHKITADDYREKYMLSKTTALISETERQRMKEVTLKWIASLTPEEKKKYIENNKRFSKEGRKLRGNTQPKESLEAKNKKGTCPDQLIAKIHEVAKKIGHTPSLAEFIDVTDGQRYKHLIFATFKSWLNALKMAKLKPKAKAENGGRRTYTDDELLEYLSLYAQENNKLPTATDSKRGLIPPYEVYRRHFGSFIRARELADVNRFIQ